MEGSRLKTYDYVIVGAGMAADAAIGGIRRHDQHGTILVIGDENFVPYQKPPLSKTLWMDMRMEDIFLRGNERPDVHLRTGIRAQSLDLARQEVTLQDSLTVGYKKLLLATGARPRRIAACSDNVYYVGPLTEHIRLFRALSSLRQVLVVGGGFIGAEMAAALSSKGHQVTWVLAEAYPFQGFLPKDLADYVAAEYRRHGVVIAANQEVTRIDGDAQGVKALTGNNEGLVGDLAILGIGVIPNDDLARSAGLAGESGGVVVDGQLCTADTRVWAAGDVAIMPGGSFMMHEDHAVTQGKIAGENMAGAHKVYTHEPFFYSDLYHFGYEAIGRLDANLSLVEDWVRFGEEGVLYYMDGKKLVGVLNWNVWDGIPKARRLLQAGAPVEGSTLIGKIQNASE